MKIGKVEKYINDVIEREGGMTFILIDPCDHKTPETAIKTAKESVESGADLILIGGSIGAQGELLDAVAKGIKEQVNVPINIFPGNTSSITRYANSIYFMSMLNSRNAYWSTMAQTVAAPVIKKLGIEAIPTGYIVISPGGTVGWVSDANLVPRHKPQIAAALAMAGELTGNRIILTDCGSNPKDGHMPFEMIKAVSDSISVPYVVGGGFRTAEQAGKAIENGADAVQIGTAVENIADVRKKVEAIVKSIKAAGRKKV
ncbi:MAG: geranylgeranylglyceryl/heptaprenylglyceryl phosphate synthase [Candidatus Aenigmarchaeota archaeon]|nr:geranylgeranylglyceryl/heptaprenylglyceryl phosphate synthase [Candidatus Aenigmarchaeota archaeon]